VSGAADDAGVVRDSVIARELRRTLQRCPACDSGYRDHSYALLATVVMNKDCQSSLRLKQYYDFLQEHRWHELLCMREWSDSADSLVSLLFVASQDALRLLPCSAQPNRICPTLRYTTRSSRQKKGRISWRFCPRKGGCHSGPFPQLSGRLYLPGGPPCRFTHSFALSRYRESSNNFATS
jgi:hypothetical protein